METEDVLQLEDIVWDDFEGSDDHIVPGDKKSDGCAGQSDVHTRLQRELASVASSADNKVVTENVGQRKEETISFTVKEKGETMLQEGTRPHISDRVFPAASDVDPDKVSDCAPDDISTFDDGLQSSNMESVCADDHVLGDQGASLENNLCRYPVASTDNDISFFSNDHQDEENSDLFNYAWPEMENFEDVFRECDSFIGVGIDNEDNVGWFSSSDAVEPSDVALKHSLDCLGSDPSASYSGTDYHEATRPMDTGQLTNDADNKPTSINWKIKAQKLDEGGVLPFSQSSFASGITSGSENLPQVNLHGVWSKHQKSAEREQENLYLENENSYVHLDNLTPIKQPRHSFGKSNLQSSSSSGILHNPTMVTVLGDSICDNNVQSQLTFVPANPFNPSQASGRSAASCVKSEANGHLSLSQKESYSSNQNQSSESSQSISFQTPIVKGERKKENLYHPNGYPGHPHDVGILPGACYGSIAVRKQVSQMQSEFKDQSKVNGSGLAVQEELDSSNAQESSCVSSVLDDVSLEASSFRQLQLVMEKLDKRTKLCIRDSLFRLARSAEQRHKGSGDNTIGTGAFTTDATNKCAGFMDMETDTNPIDRSIAHLLFHRPSDTSATPGPNVVPGIPNAKVHAAASSSNGPPVMAEKSAPGGVVLDVADNRPVENPM